MQIYNNGMKKTILTALFVVAFISFFFVPAKITAWFFVQKAVAFAVAGYSAWALQRDMPDERA